MGGIIGGGGGGTKVKETNSQKILAQIGGQEFVDYENRWKPEVQAANVTESQLGSGVEREKLAGMNVGGVEQGLGLPSAGFTGGEGKVSPLAIAGREVERAQGRSNAETSADVASTGRHIAGEENIIQRGRGQQAQAVSGLETQAGIDAARESARAQLEAENQNAALKGIGSLAGAGLGAAYGGLGGTKSTSNLTSEQAQGDIGLGLSIAPPSQGFGTGLGGV